MKFANKLFLIFLTMLSSCSGQDTRKLSLLVPSGSPLVSVAGVLDEVDYEVTVGPDLLPAAFMAGEKDIIVSPIIVGAKLYNKDVSDYTLRAMIGWGNLHILSRYAITSIEDLDNKRILAFAEHSTPGIMLRLATSNIDVDINYYKAVSDVGAPFLQGQFDYVLMSEPLLSKIKGNVQGECYTYSLQNVETLPTIAQFGLFAKEDINVRKLNNLLDYLEDSIRYLNTNPKEYAAEVVGKDAQLTALGEKVITDAIPNFNFDFVRSNEVKNVVDEFLAYLVASDINLIGASNVDGEFYG